MVSTYLIWTGLVVLSIFVVVIVGLKAGRAVQRHDNAIDPMFRRPRNGTNRTGCAYRSSSKQQRN